MKYPCTRKLLLGIVTALGIGLAPYAPSQPAPPAEFHAHQNAPLAPRAVDRIPALRADLEALFSDTSMEQAFWGVMVQSMDTGEIIYRKNHNKSPGSTAR